MITSTTGRGQQHTFTMDVWDQNMNGSKCHTTSVPAEVFKKGFRKHRQSKARWYLIIGISIAIIIVAIVVIALAVHFAIGNEGEDDTLAADSKVETFHLGNKEPTTKAEPTPNPTTRKHNADDSSWSHGQKSTTRKHNADDSSWSHGQKSTTSTKTWKLSTQTPDSTSRSTNVHTKVSQTMTSTITRSTSTQRIPTRFTKVFTDSQTTKTFSSSSLSSEVPTNQAPTSAKTSSNVHDTSVSSFQSSTLTTAHSTKVHETTKQTTTAANNTLTTGEPTTSSHNASNIVSGKNKTVLTFDNSNITLPFNGSPLTLRCVALYAKGWTDLKIVRKNGKDRNALAVVTSGVDSPSVYVIDANFSSEVSYKTDALMVTLYSNTVDCSYTGEYSCIISTMKEIKEINTQVHTIDSQPKLEIPTSIVEGGQITLKCSVEVTGQNGTLKWKLRPPGLHTYFDLSLSPTTSKTESECSTTISSVLTFNPQMHDNGSFFRCEVTVIGDDNTLTQTNTLFSEEEFFVVPKSFCEDKKPYSINVHPDNSCDMVIYCFVDGPHVYQIDCDPGMCYDIQKTRCLPVS